jgi:hypothetical protein
MITVHFKKMNGIVIAVHPMDVIPRGGETVHLVDTENPKAGMLEYKVYEVIWEPAAHRVNVLLLR